MSASRKLALVVLAPLLAVCALVFSGAAQAEIAAPGWDAVTSTVPTNLPPGGNGIVEIDLYNVGASSSSGTVTVTDVLPPRVTAVEAFGLGNFGNVESQGSQATNFWTCAIAATDKRLVTCTRTSPIAPGGTTNLGGEMRTDRLGIPVTVAAGGSEVESNHVTITGGGALTSTSLSSPVVLSSSVPAFGLANFDAWFSNANGTIDTQAGSHPYELTVSFNMNDYYENPDHERNIIVNTPPGIVGDPTAIPQCTRQAFDNEECPASTQIGIDRPGLSGELGSKFPPGDIWLPLYNLVPPKGVPAQFGFVVLGIHTFLDAGVRTGGDNGITEHADNITENKSIASNSITLWGVPAESSHDRERCQETSTSACAETVGASSDAEPKPLLTLPTSCGAPPRFTIEANSWQEPGNIQTDEFLMQNNEGVPTGFTGCEKLVHFGPEIAIAPDTSFSDTPAGLGVEVRMPPDTNPEGLATSGLKNTTVTLPEGVVINPGQATGLQACQPAQENIGGGEAKREEQEGPARCPAASKVGTDEIETPLLKEKLKGSVYVLQQNPPNLQLLVTASGEGVNLKLVGNVHLNEQTGRLTTTFEETPDLPFTTFKLNFSGGAQAALATPVDCGVYSSSALFVPWSSPFVQSFPTSSAFQIGSGPGGGACPSSPLPFAPSLIAGATTDQAGGFTGFSMLLQSGDGQQRIEKLQFKAPQGLSGMISQVPLCPEPQAAQGTCSAVSQIGHSIVASGPGPYPLVVPQAGDPESPIYLTGPYEGAPFGLSIVTHVIAGPFNLGTVITRARIEVDPHTAQITVTTDPLPQIIAGVPTDLRTVDAVIDRPGFMFNPTNCNSSSFSGTAWGTSPPGAGGLGAMAAIGSHFQVGSCQSLKFAPNFKVSTSGRTSKQNGASLDVRILYPTGALGANQASSQANIAKVKVELPKQLPSRLTTLQKACTAAQFDANPAGCPPASVIGHATAVTPELPVPLTGPAYFVSNGGEAFPNLIMVLQGYGVTIELVGDTFINKAGITSSTFKTVPDAPVTSFDLTLPEGRYSALTANGSLCRSRLSMPTEFTGQNGAVLEQSTKISVTGCAKARILTRAQRLTKALKACHKIRGEARRRACAARAHKRYGPHRRSGSSRKG
jgi:hypothetical protein